MNKPSILRKLSVGDAFVPGRDFLNSLISAGQDAKRGEDANPEDFADSLSQVDVLVRNESDHDYGQYDVIGLGVALIDPNTDVNEFLRIPAFSSDSPVDPSDIGNWALCLEPIEMGKYGMARAAGLCFAGITAGSSDPVEAFAEMSDSSPNLVFDPDGSAKVLWAEATGTDRWAIVRIGGAGAGIANSPLTTKGDVWGYSSADARIPVGSNGQMLMADSTQTLGVKYAFAKLRGTLAGTLSFGGSATMNIAGGGTVTVYDWLLSSGQTVASGIQVTVFLDADGKYYVDGAQCA